MKISVKIRLERLVGGLCIGYAIVFLAVIMSGHLSFIFGILETSVGRLLAVSYVCSVILGSICFSIERTKED